MKFVLSGVKPTGIPTLGNYLGALKNFVSLQNEMKDYEFLIFIADLHAITTYQDPQELKSHIRTVAALYLACGLDLDTLTLFIQSEVSEHVALGYIMESLAYIGELERMTQYKDKMQKQIQGVSTALFTYPALMAADILLYNATFVPVGADQIQHLELTRDLANRFNNRYGETFVVPQILTTKLASRIMDLQNPLQKMDKSTSNPKGCIYLTESLTSIKKKIKSAVTDSEGIVKYDRENKPGIANLMTIYASISNLSFEEIEKKYHNIGYGVFKNDLAELVEKEIAPIQEAFHKWYNSNELDVILDEGKARASMFARSNLNKIYKKMGIGR